MSLEIDPTIPCLNRYEITDTNNLRDCCYRTCATFLGPQNVGNIIHSSCGERCRNLINQSVQASGNTNLLVHQLAVPFLELQSGNFKNCYQKYNNSKNALECCLNMADSNREQQLCIDAYNSLINVRESYIGTPSDRCLIFFIFVLVSLNGGLLYYNNIKTNNKFSYINLLILNILVSFSYFLIMNIL
jgi:hypothetical protein